MSILMPSFYEWFPKRFSTDIWNDKKIFLLVNYKFPISVVMILIRFMSLRSGSAPSNLIFSCYLCFNICFLSINSFISYHRTLIHRIHYTYVSKYTYLDSCVHEDLNLVRGRDITRVYQAPCIFPITIIWWKIMSTIVQVQYDKCESPNWSIGPEWWVAFFFF